jgi:SsrA-binding protein
MKKIEFTNKKVKFEYTFIDTYVTGIKLIGSEVKSIRLGKVSLVDTYCYFSKGELYLKGLNISETNVAYSHTAIRDRKLLLKRKQLNKLENEILKGLSIVPYKIFINDRGLVKVEIVLGKGKKLWDKRDSIKERDINRDMMRDI